jgi:hypothetical protein
MHRVGPIQRKKWFSLDDPLVNRIAQSPSQTSLLAKGAETGTLGDVHNPLRKV